MLNAKDISIWQQVHAVPYAGLLVHSLDLLRDRGLVVSIINEKSKGALTARSVLAISAELVPIGEADIFDSSQLDPSKAVDIKGTPMAEDIVLNLA